jgi:nucleotide-binding universal stress UspA family protein
MTSFAPRQILTAIDFSEVSTCALRHGMMWAQQYGAQLTVLHAHEFPPIGLDLHFGADQLGSLVEATQQAVAQQMADYLHQHVPPDVSAHPKLINGSPPEVIEAYAASWPADLVVLGTHGRGGLSRLLLGSVAEQTLRLATRPTLIVRPVPAGETSEPEAPRLQQILCPVNYTEVARAAFEHACAVAASFNARLTVVFALEPKESALTAESLREAEQQLRSWLPSESVGNYEIQPIVRHGDAAERVIMLAWQATDLIVIGAQHRRFVDTTVLGVTTVRVTRHAPCPVLVVPRSSDTGPA